MVEISFTEPAIDGLRRVGPEAVPKVLKKLLILLADPKAGYPLGGELTGYRNLVVGRNTWRIVYRLIDGSAIEVCEVWAVGARADAEIYAEAAARVREAARQRPEFQRLADVVERLGRLADGTVVEQPPPAPDPVPDWLADRLVHIVGLARAEVAAMSLQQAVDRWGAYMAEPKQP
jgi:mRNA interferase RelE/StbE